MQYGTWYILALPTKSQFMDRIHARKIRDAGTTLFALVDDGAFDDLYTSPHNGADCRTLIPVFIYLRSDSILNSICYVVVVGVMVVKTRSLTRIVSICLREQLSLLNMFCNIVVVPFFFTLISYGAMIDL